MCRFDFSKSSVWHHANRFAPLPLPSFVAELSAALFAMSDTRLYALSALLPLFSAVLSVFCLYARCCVVCERQYKARGRFCVFLQANDPQQGWRFKDLLFVFAIAVSSLVPYITDVFGGSCPHDSRRRDGIALLSLGLYGFCKSAQNASASSGVAFVAWRQFEKSSLVSEKQRHNR